MDEEGSQLRCKTMAENLRPQPYNEAVEFCCIILLVRDISFATSQVLQTTLATWCFCATVP
eukprot:1085223-Karenia_brevis.AAC.1